jgi:hypothetical protein
MYSMLPPRSSGSAAFPAARKASPSAFSGQAPVFEVARSRVLAKLEDRMDVSASKRMPSSLLRQSLRTFAEQLAEQEGRGLPRPERERLVEEVLAELLGYGPLEELFHDQTVREVLVAGPHAVLVRREHGTWLPANVRFRDEEHLRKAIDRLATHADPVGGVTTSVNLFDLKLPNGFRAVAVVPPPALGMPANVAFIRIDPTVASATPTPPAWVGASMHATPAADRALPDALNAPSRPGSGSVAPSASRPIDPGADPLAKHRTRLMERLLAKLASLGVYDVRRLEVAEFRKVVAAYVAEYCAKEAPLLNDTEQARLQLEILTAMHR